MPFVLTGEVAPEARLGCDHPLCSGFTEDRNGAFGLLPQSCQSTAKTTHYGVHLIVGQPIVLSHDKLQTEIFISASDSLVVIIHLKKGLTFLPF